MTEPARADRPAPPWPPTLLGAAGVIPFVGAGALLAFGPPTLAGPALLWLVAYAAVILSFLGGVRWGAEIARSEQPRFSVLALSVLPSLAGWVLLAVPFATAELQLGGFLLAFAWMWLWDSRAVDLKPWYRRLRSWLTLGAAIGLGLGLAEALGRL